MKKNSNENLSALVDGEHCSDKSLLKDLIKNENMKSTWRRYHLIRDCLRGNLTDNVNNDFTENLKHELQNDPIIYTPKINKQFKELGVVQFTKIGDIVDPELHDALMMRTEEGKEENTVLEVFEKGYRYKDRVIRHAKVVVNQTAS